MDRWLSETKLWIYSERVDGSLQFLGHTTPSAYLLNHRPSQRAEVRKYCERGEAVSVAWDGNYTVFSPHDLAEKGADVR